MDHLLKKAIELQRKGDLPGAKLHLRKAINSGTRIPQCYYFLAVLEEATGEIENAFQSIEKALKLAPNEADFWYCKGNIVQKLKQPETAIEAYLSCVRLNPDHVEALVNLSLVYQRLEQLEDALEFAQKAMQVQPTEVKAWLACIGTLGYLRRFDEAIKFCAEADALFKNNPEIIHMMGNILLASGDVDGAFPCYENALQLSPESVLILTSMGDFHAQYRSGRDAIPFLEKALSLNPHSLDAQHRLGTAYLTSGFPADAVPQLLKVLQQNPDNADAFDGLLLAALYLDGADENEIFQLHLQWAKHHGNKALMPTRDAGELWNGKRPLRIGFVSPDFRNHSVTRFCTPLFRRVSDCGCELFCYSDVKRRDRFTDDLEKFGVNWIYSYRMTDDVLAARIHGDQIDVLVDLAGHTGNNRLQVFARKPAPIQVSWLGYPFTTGLGVIDYRLSDAVADPEGESDRLSSERIIRLPDGFHCFEPPIQLPDIQPLAALEIGYITFGSFNNQSKINEATLRCWKRIMDAVPDSRLLLKNHQLSDSRNREHWLSVMDHLGIDNARVEMVGYASSLEDHYRTYGRVDIALDTFPYNGTTTTCEALWMGVPVLTMLGNSQRSRTGASLLIHAGLSEWVAKDEDSMVILAAQWTRRLQELNRLRLGLRSQLLASPIGDQAAFSRKFFGMMRTLAESQTMPSC